MTLQMFLQMREIFGTLQMFVRVCCSFCRCVSRMQMRPPDARMQCCCMYKCEYGSNGYAWVYRRTWHNHQRLVAADEVHSCVWRNLKKQRATHESDTTHSPQGAECQKNVHYPISTGIFFILVFKIFMIPFHYATPLLLIPLNVVLLLNFRIVYTSTNSLPSS